MTNNQKPEQTPKPKGKRRSFLEYVDTLLSGNPHIRMPKTTNRNLEISQSLFEKEEEEREKLEKENEEFDLDAISEEWI